MYINSCSMERSEAIISCKIPDKMGLSEIYKDLHLTEAS